MNTSPTAPTEMPGESAAGVPPIPYVGGCVIERVIVPKLVVAQLFSAWLAWSLHMSLTDRALFIGLCVMGGGVVEKANTGDVPAACCTVVVAVVAATGAAAVGATVGAGGEVWGWGCPAAGAGEST